MSDAQSYFDVLRHIGRDFASSDEVVRKSEQLYGLDPHETVAMAYDHLIQLAKDAVKGKRRPA